MQMQKNTCFIKGERRKVLVAPFHDGQIGLLIQHTYLPCAPELDWPQLDSWDGVCRQRTVTWGLHCSCCAVQSPCEASCGTATPASPSCRLHPFIPQYWLTRSMFKVERGTNGGDADQDDVELARFDLAVELFLPALEGLQGAQHICGSGRETQKWSPKM